ncbi:MAG: hypothetical protein Fur0034_05250 [Desulfuromonadia bacterium]
MARKLLLLLLSIPLAGCMQVITPEHRSQADRSITIDNLLRDPVPHLGKKVIVGGVIAENREDQGMSLLVIASLPLNDDLVPDPTSLPGERYIARSADYLPPGEYGVGRYVTIFGELIGQKRIEERNAPVISAREIYGWDPEKFNRKKRWWSLDENPYADTHDTQLKPRPLDAVPDPGNLR